MKSKLKNFLQKWIPHPFFMGNMSPKICVIFPQKLSFPPPAAQKKTRHGFLNIMMRWPIYPEKGAEIQRVPNMHSGATHRYGPLKRSAPSVAHLNGRWLGHTLPDGREMVPGRSAQNDHSWHWSIVLSSACGGFIERSKPSISVICHLPQGGRKCNLTPQKNAMQKNAKKCKKKSATYKEIPL